MTDEDVAGGPSLAGPPRCPVCGAAMVPIEYGMPGPEMQEASERGEIILGGCCIIEGAMPEWGCRACEEVRYREEQRLWGAEDDDPDEATEVGEVRVTNEN